MWRDALESRFEVCGSALEPSNGVVWFESSWSRGLKCVAVRWSRVVAWSGVKPRSEVLCDAVL